MIVVLDSNIWISESLLRTPRGAALLYSLRQLDGRVAFNTVIKKEITRNIIEKRYNKAVRNVKRGMRTIQIISGEKPEIRMPSDEEIRNSILERFDEISDYLEFYNLNIDDYESAADRIIYKKSPSKNGEEFRDSLIWEMTLELGIENDIHIVTNDSDFCQNKNPNKGLDKDLESEFSELEGDINHHKDISDFLSYMEEDIEHPDKENIARIIKEHSQSRLQEESENKEFVLGDFQGYSIDIYLTEEDSILSVDFALNYDAFDITDSEGNEIEKATFVAKGSCSYNLDEESVDDIEWDEMTCVNSDGESIPGTGTVFVRAGTAVIGTRHIPYTLQENISNLFDLEES